MNLDEALDIVVNQMGRRRYVDLCNPSHPDYNPDYAPVVIKMASEYVPMPTVTVQSDGSMQPTYPSAIRQAYNAIGAAGRAIGAAVTGQIVVVPPEVAAERLAICNSCDKYNASKSRCKACGCYQLKMTLATERCPLNPPKWSQYVDTNLK